jgi:hypothetical protein
MAMSYPPIFINKYLAEKVAEEFDGNFTLPFFPTMPTDIDALTETFPLSNGTFAVYDRMFKYRRTPFPHIKSEQLLYYFYKMQGDSELMIEVSQKAYDLLDREDESAQELNEWIRSLPRNPNGTISFGNDPTEFNPVFFHKMKMYQLEETRDIVDFGTARTYAGNKIIVDYDYHQIV